MCKKLSKSFTFQLKNGFRQSLVILNAVVNIGRYSNPRNAVDVNAECLNSKPSPENARQVVQVDGFALDITTSKKITNFPDKFSL